MPKLLTSTIIPSQKPKFPHACNLKIETNTSFPSTAWYLLTVTPQLTGSIEGLKLSIFIDGAAPLAHKLSNKREPRQSIETHYKLWKKEVSKKLKINSVPGKGRSDLSGMRKRKDTFHYTFVCLLRNKKTNVVFIAFHQRRSGSSCLWTIFVRSNISESKSVKIGFE